MIKTVLSISLLLPIAASAGSKKVDCNKHKIYCHMLDNYKIANKGKSIKVNKRYAMRVSNVIYKMARRYNLDQRLFTAILAQESTYRVGAKNCARGILAKGSRLLKVKSKYINGRVCFDFGIGQINISTVEDFGFDIHKLLTDLHYSVEASAIILREKRRMHSKKDKEWWWSRYNAGNKRKRKVYQDNVGRFL